MATNNVTVMTASTASTPSLEADWAAWQKLCELAVRWLDKMISLEPKVLRGNKPRAIHDFRVASRRVQQALDVLVPSPRPPEIRRLRRRVRRCRRACSDVRNCDVFIKRAEKALTGKRSRRRDTWQAILDYLSERRKKTHARAMRKLTKLHLARVYVHLQNLLAPNAEASEIPGIAGDRLKDELDRTWQRFETAAIRLQESAQPEIVHGARIAGKKLRYLVEIFEEMEIAGSGEAMAWLRKLQDSLGNWHDLDVQSRMMAEMIAHPQFLSDKPDLSMQILRIILQNRKKHEPFKTARAQWAFDSEGGAALKSWVQSVIAQKS